MAGFAFVERVNLQSGIYEIVNSNNGKRYIGSAKSFKIRWAKHLGDLRLGKHHSRYLQRSWAIYGAEAFVFKIVELCAVSDLISREQSWLDTYKPEYNVSPTAANCTGVKHSDATKLKHSLAMRGRKFPEAAAKRTGQKRTPEQRARFSEAQKLAYEILSPDEKRTRSERIAKVNRDRLLGTKQSPEVVAKRAKSMLGRVVSVETRAKISAANKGKRASEATREKMRAARIGRAPTENMLKALRENAKKRIGIPRPPHVVEALRKSNANRSAATLEKMAAARRGKKLSKEVIEKRTATRRATGGYSVSAETREKLSAAGMGRCKSPESIRKMLESRRANRAAAQSGLVI